MKITINEFETLFKLVVEKLLADKLTEVDIDLDEYWLVSASEWDNFEITPELCVGSLEDDIKYLKESITENAIYSYSDFDRLATVLRAISQKQAPI